MGNTDATSARSHVCSMKDQSDVLYGTKDTLKPSEGDSHCVNTSICDRDVALAEKCDRRRGPYTGQVCSSKALVASFVKAAH